MVCQVVEGSVIVLRPQQPHKQANREHCQASLEDPFTPPPRRSVVDMGGVARLRLSEVTQAAPAWGALGVREVTLIPPSDGCTGLCARWHRSSSSWR